MEHVEVTRKGTPSRCCLENSREWCAHQGISSWRFGYIMNKTVKRLIKEILCLLQSVLEPNEMLRIRQASCSAERYGTMQIPESTDQFSTFLVGFDTIPNWRPLPDSIHNAAASHNFHPSMRINSTLLKGVPGRTSRPQTTNNQMGYAERTRYADNSAERIPRLISVGFEVVKNGTKAKLKVYGLRRCFPKLLKAIFAPSRLGFRQFMSLVSSAVASLLILQRSHHLKFSTNSHGKRRIPKLCFSKIDPAWLQIFFFRSSSSSLQFQSTQLPRSPFGNLGSYLLAGP